MVRLHAEAGCRAGDVRAVADAGAVERIGIGLRDLGPVVRACVVVVTREVPAVDDLRGRERAVLDDRAVVGLVRLDGAGTAEIRVRVVDAAVDDRDRLPVAGRAVVLPRKRGADERHALRVVHVVLGHRVDGLDARELRERAQPTAGDPELDAVEGVLVLPLDLAAELADPSAELVLVRLELARGRHLLRPRKPAGRDAGLVELDDDLDVATVDDLLDERLVELGDIEPLELALGTGGDGAGGCRERDRPGPMPPERPTASASCSSLPGIDPGSSRSPPTAAILCLRRGALTPGLQRPAWAVIPRMSSLRGARAAMDGTRVVRRPDAMRCEPGLSSRADGATLPRRAGGGQLSST